MPTFYITTTSATHQELQLSVPQSTLVSAPVSPGLLSKPLSETRLTAPQPSVSFGSVCFPNYPGWTPFTLCAAQSIPGFRCTCRIHAAFRFLQQVAISFKEVTIYQECKLWSPMLHHCLPDPARCMPPSLLLQSSLPCSPLPPCH